MHTHSDADVYMQIVHTRVARKFMDAYLCTALYVQLYIIFKSNNLSLIGAWNKFLSDPCSNVKFSL